MGFRLFKRRTSVDAVRIGAVYRRTVTGNIVETARVLALSRNTAAIPHVRFVVRNSLGHESAADELRTLSLESFLRMFGEPIAGQ